MTRMDYRWRAVFESTYTLETEDGVETILRTVQRQGKMEVDNAKELLMALADTYSAENITRLELERLV